MTADVTECPQRALFVAHDYDRFTRKVRGEKSLGLRDRALYAVHFPASLVQRTDKLPRAPEKSCFFQFPESMDQRKSAMPACARTQSVS